jgi:RecB family exonuclease
MTELTAPVKPPIKLSVSKTKTWTQCKKRFYYSYIQRLPKKEQPHLFIGSCAHKILELYHMAFLEGTVLPKNVVMKDAFSKALKEYQDKLQDAVVEHEDKTTTPARQWLYEMSLSYLKKEYQQPDGAIILGCEKPFEINIDGKVILNGAIDRIQLNTNGIVEMVDYKTSKNDKYLKDDAFQLQTYAFVFKHYQNTDQKWAQQIGDIDRAQGSYMMLKHEFERVPFEFSLEEIMAIPDKFLKYADEIQNETEYPHSPTPLCGWCDFNTVCQGAFKPRWKSKPVDTTPSHVIKWGI